MILIPLLLKCCRVRISVTSPAPLHLSAGQNCTDLIALSSFDLLQATVMSDEASLEKSMSACTLRKGLLWQQRDKIFSRWKERFFVLTPDYLNCFKRGTSRISEMGEFLFKVSHRRPRVGRSV